MWKEIVLEWLDRNERSQAYLARKAKVNIFHLNGCLRGKRECGERTLRKLEMAMGLEPDTLMALKNGKVPEPA